MSVIRSKVGGPIVVGVLGGIGYAAVVLSWMFSRGVSVSPGDPGSVVVGVGVSVSGVVLMAAVPLYLLARFSLVLPAATTVLLLGNTVYQDLYGTHLHPLISYLTVWPLLFGVAMATGVPEVLFRVAVERRFGLGGLRSLLG